MDKEERWVCGEKVSVKDGDKNYMNLVKYHREGMGIQGAMQLALLNAQKENIEADHWERQHLE